MLFSRRLLLACSRSSSRSGLFDAELSCVRSLTRALISMSEWERKIRRIQNVRCQRHQQKRAQGGGPASERAGRTNERAKRSHTKRAAARPVDSRAASFACAAEEAARLNSDARPAGRRRERIARLLTLPQTTTAQWAGSLPLPPDAHFYGLPSTTWKSTNESLLTSNSFMYRPVLSVYFDH